MKKISQTAAGERLNRTELNNYEGWQTHPKSVYECPCCNELLAICFRDFEKHSCSRHSHLTKEIASRIDEHVGSIDSLDADSYLDFVCQGCEQSVRIYYISWLGGRHGDAGHSALFVVEVEG